MFPFRKSEESANLLEVLNSQITGGQHVGRTFVNAFVTGNETNGAHRATTQEDDDMDDADGDAG